MVIRKSYYMSIEQLNIIIASLTSGFAAVAIALAQFYNARSKAGYEHNHALIEQLKAEMNEWKEQSIRYQAMIDVRDKTIEAQDREIIAKNEIIMNQDKMIAGFRAELKEMKTIVERVEEENIELKKQMEQFLNLNK